MAIAESPVYAEVYRFLVSSPTPEEIIAFRPSQAVQSRVRELLVANKERCLSEDEEAELDEFERVSHLVTMLKLYAEERLTVER